MNLSEFSSEVEGFDSTWDEDRQVMVKDASTDTFSSKVEMSIKSLSTRDSKEVGIQATPIVLSNSNEETDKKLAAWLKKILPAVEKELVEGLTPVYGRSDDSEELPLRITEYQEIDVAQNFKGVEGFTLENLQKGAATWLSVSTQDSPVLAISCAFTGGEQKTCFVIVFEPKRSKIDAKIYWHELVTIPVKEPIEFLATNPQNRDMFAGASIAGDLYVWNYHNMPSAENNSRVTEIFSKTSDDSIEAIAFANDNKLLCCQNDGRIFVYKVSKQSTTVDKIMKIEPRNARDPKITCIAHIPDTEEFVLGLFNGSLLHCSMNQLIPQDGDFNPILKELQTHKFPITTLKFCLHRERNYIVSCDLSGEVHFFEVDDTMERQPKLVVKLPLAKASFGKITCRNNMEQILCLNGASCSLEVIRTSTKARESFVEGKSGGSANIIELSRNEFWLVVGVQDGIFKIYYVM